LDMQPTSLLPETRDDASRGDAQWTNKRATAQAVRAAKARHESGRRRFVDPTTCERNYSNSEMEFMQAMQDYKASSGRLFPTWSEVLEVLKDLGYEKPARMADSA
jgi:outer membrane protein TolC